MRISDWSSDVCSSDLLKTIPDADPELARQAGLYADRLSINVELPTEQGLRRLAPEKDGQRIESAMAGMRDAIEDGSDASRRYAHAPRFAPVGQSTQMIVAAAQAANGRGWGGERRDQNVRESGGHVY